ncbi:hypothetical protein LB507_001457 [Fusarium sp. FIESC RH6]|nr:hypothetical protein LB507_001457 [Fusarium sp. FIESC RH6]
MSNPHAYTVAWICAVSTERVAAEVILDEEHELPTSVSPHDNNSYKLGKIGGHMVVIAVLPDGEYGTSSVACVARDLLHTFPNVRIGLMVGIGGGAPSKKHDIRLGDIVVGATRGGKSSVLQYDFGKAIQNQSLEMTGFMNQAPSILRTAIAGLRARHEIDGHSIQEAGEQALAKKPRLRKKYKFPGHENDRLYRSHIIHQDGGCPEHCGDDETVLVTRSPRDDEDDDPTIHYGVIASADKLMKDASIRDRLARDHDILCFEMEAAGLVNHFPCLIIRGICDYSDTHKNDQWQGYAAMVAAAYAKELLLQIVPSNIENERKISDILSELQGSVGDVIEELKPVSKIIHSKYERDILEWLTVHEYAISHKDIFAKAESGTGQWFLNSRSFRTWLNNDKQSLLSCGSPGAGKTVISSIVVNYLLSEFQQSPNIGIAYIYCNYQRHTEQGAVDILSNLLKQLAQTRSPLPRSVQDLYRVHERFRTHPTFPQISEALIAVSADYSKVFIVIDALDECNASNNTRATVLREILRLQNHANANIFATSRPNREISNFFSGSLTQKIAATNDDIGTYLNKQISLNCSLILDDELRCEMYYKVVVAANGMFLLARLHTRTLLSQPTKGDLLDHLRTLNKRERGLDEQYDEAMRRIQDQEPERKALAMKILTWIVHAEKPLTMQMLKHALAVREDCDELDKNYIPRSETILSLCAGLVTVEKDWVALFAGLVTGEKVRDVGNVWFADAEAEMIITCGTYLSLRSAPGSTRRRKRLLPLYDYALYHWYHHVREIPGRATEWLLRFAKAGTKIPFNEPVDEYQDLPRTGLAGLHLAAYCDLRQIAAHLIGSGFCADEQDADGRTPLSYAADAGREAIVNLLLAEGDVDPNSPSKCYAFRGMTPLMFASKNRHKAVVDLLLDRHDIDIDAQDSDGKTALFHAVISGDMSVVAGLRKKGANMEITDNGGKTVITVAVGKGDVNWVEFLLNCGASPNPTPAGRNDKTPLSCAASDGQVDIVKLLLDKGADPYLGKRYHTLLLFLATSAGRAEVVKVLLQWGVNPEGGSEACRTPLSVAAKEGHMAIAKLLLDTGKVDPQSNDGRDLKDSQGRTPLSYAAGDGHEAVVKLLLSAYGAQPDSKDNKSRTPLSYAAANGHEAVVKLLLSTCGVQPDSKDSDGRTPLSYAAGDGREAVVKLLLSTCGVDPNSRAEYPAGMTPLRFACSHGQPAIVEVLLNDDRIDPDSRLSEDGNEGPTELFVSAWWGREAILKLLLDSNKVNVNLRDTNGWTPLDYAKNNSIRFLLREKGARRGRDL